MGEEKSLVAVTKKETDLEKIVIKQREKPVEKPDPDEKILVVVKPKSMSVFRKPLPQVEVPSGPVGLDFVRPVQMFYCDLCHRYLPKVSPEEADLCCKDHCSSSGHRESWRRQEQERIMEQEEARNGDKETKKDDDEEKIKVEETGKEEQADIEIKTTKELKEDAQKGAEVEQKAAEEKQDNEEDSYELIVNTEETFDDEKGNFSMEDHDKLDYEAEEPEKLRK